MKVGRGRGTNSQKPGYGYHEADIRSAAVNACLLEEAAELQLRALAAVGGNGERLTPFTPEEIARARSEFEASGPRTRANSPYAHWSPCTRRPQRLVHEGGGLPVDVWSRLG